MDDDRVWTFEESLWTADAARYRELIDDECVMVVPAEPFVVTGGQAMDTVANTPRWQSVRFSNQQIKRPQEGLIVIGYTVEASRDEERYLAHCTSTYRRLSHEEWRVVQHQQTLPPMAEADAEEG